MTNFIANSNKSFLLVTLIGMMMCNTLLQAQTVYVDNQLKYNCYGNYSIANRDSSGCEGIAVRSLSEAAKTASKGMVVEIREGIYNEPLIPQYSGDEDHDIVFQNYLNERVVISGNGLSPAIFIDRKNHITLDGIIVKNVFHWLNALESNHLIIRNCTFKNATDPDGSSKTGVFFQGCSYCKILDNTIDSTTQDNLAFIGSDHNLIEGNSITRAKHTLWTFKCSNFNIMRRNYFHNSLQKIGEILDCDHVGFGSESFPKITSFDDSKFNLIEGNVFAYTPPRQNRSPYAGIQFAGQNCIVRENIFYNCSGPPVDLTVYSDEALHNYNNMVYNNVFSCNHFGGIGLSGSSNGKCYGHQIVNNIFFNNDFEQHDFRWDWYNGLSGKPVQIFIGRTDIASFRNNNLFNGNDSINQWALACGVRNSGTNPEAKPISWWENNHPELLKGTIETNPRFKNTIDFQLSHDSPLIDAGAFLTNTACSGSGSTKMIVKNVMFFTDGFGISKGDIIQLEGQTATAEIKSIEYNTNTLTLSIPLSWQEGQGLSLRYKGNSPDIGLTNFKQVFKKIN